MLLRILYFPFDVDWCVALNITLYVHLFAFCDRNLFVFRCKMCGYCELKEHTKRSQAQLTQHQLNKNDVNRKKKEERSPRIVFDVLSSCNLGQNTSKVIFLVLTVNF